MGIQSVKRALSILSLFSTAKTHIGITEIGKSLGISNPTIHALVRTLCDDGFLEQDSKTKKYCLGAKNYELGHYFLGSSKVYQVGSTAIHRLAQNTALTTRAAIRDKDSIIVIVCVYPSADRFQHYPVGPRIPLYCSALGKAILSCLPQAQLTTYLERTSLVRYTPGTITNCKSLLKDLKKARLRGYAKDREEMVRGVACAAAPIFDQSGVAIASLSISSGTDLFEHHDISKLINELIQTTTEISHSLGYNPNIIASNR